MTKIVNHLYLSGGGINGIAFLGAYKKLLKMHKHKQIIIDLQSITAISIGCVYAFFIILDIDYNTLKRRIFKTDFNKLKNLKISNLLKTKGFEDGNLLLNWIKDIVGNTNAELKFRDLTIDFNICVAKLHSKELYKFNKTNTPDMKILDAIRHAITIPIVFSPKKIGSDYFLDAILVSNFPYDSFRHKENSLGLCIKHNFTPRQEKDDLISYIHSVITSLIKNKTANENFDLKDLIYIKIDNSGPLNWGIDKKNKLEIIKTGYVSVKDHFTN